MKIIRYTVYFFVLLLLSCDKSENPYVEKDVIDDIITAQNPTIEHVALIFNNDIYYLADLAQTGKRITNTPTQAKKEVRMSHDHKKFAYKNTDDQIVIVDNIGKTITTLTQYTDVRSFDWSKDDQTLYILNGNTMAYYGHSLNLPEFEYPGFVAGRETDRKIISASVSLQGDLAYIIRGFNFQYGDVYKMVIQPKVGAQIVFTDDVTSRMGYVSFSNHKQDLVLGFSIASNAVNYLEKIYVFVDLKRETDYNFGSAYGLFNPHFRSDKSYLVTGYSKGTSSADYTVKPAAIGFDKNSDKDIFNETYNVGMKPLYMDWK